MIQEFLGHQLDDWQSHALEAQTDYNLKLGHVCDEWSATSCDGQI